jgi:hypothetical protein
MVKKTIELINSELFLNSDNQSQSLYRAAEMEIEITDSKSQSDY